jgi:hypothetical protein
MMARMPAFKIIRGKELEMKIALKLSDCEHPRWRFLGLGLGLGYWLAFYAPTPQGAAGFWQAAVAATIMSALLGGLLQWLPATALAAGTPEASPSLFSVRSSIRSTLASNTGGPPRRARTFSPQHPGSLGILMLRFHFNPLKKFMHQIHSNIRALNY